MKLRCNCDERVAARDAYWQAVVNDLLDRIQAPERAPFIDQPEPALSEKKPYVTDSPHDDDLWNELVGATPDEELG